MPHQLRENFGIFYFDYFFSFQLELDSFDGKMSGATKTNFYMRLFHTLSHVHLHGPILKHLRGGNVKKSILFLGLKDSMIGN